MVTFHSTKCVISKVSRIIHQRWSDKTSNAILNFSDKYILELGSVSVNITLEQYYSLVKLYSTTIYGTVLLEMHRYRHTTAPSPPLHEKDLNSR